MSIVQRIKNETDMTLISIRHCGFYNSIFKLKNVLTLTLSLWNGFKKLPAISPSSRGVPGGLFMPAMLLGEFYNI